jgi:hypothetical protein
LERTKRRLTMLVDGTMPVAWGRTSAKNEEREVGQLGAYRSGTEFGGSDGHVGGRLVFEATGFEDVLNARCILEIRIRFLQGRDGMIST